MVKDLPLRRYLKGRFNTKITKGTKDHEGRSNFFFVLFVPWFENSEITKSRKRENTKWKLAGNVVLPYFRDVVIFFSKRWFPSTVSEARSGFVVRSDC